MQTPENDSAVIVLSANEEGAPAAQNNNYEAVRHNAMKHGILSRYTVLSHEDGSEYQVLLSALLEEHQPAGMTEVHLVEELAGIIWRKRRVLQAEGAKINEGLKSAVNSTKSVMTSAAPFQRGISGENTDLLEFMEETSEEMAERQRDTELDLAATRKAAAILRKGGLNAYTKARRVLIPDSRDWWDEYVDAEEYPATAEGLKEFIQNHLEPVCFQMAQEARYAHEIKAQILGEGLQAYRLEKLNRYETHLDRKFERTLAMLIKMKELHGNK